MEVTYGRMQRPLADLPQFLWLQRGAAATCRYRTARHPRQGQVCRAARPYRPAMDVNAVAPGPQGTQRRIHDQRPEDQRDEALDWPENPVVRARRHGRGSAGLESRLYQRKE